MNSIQNNLPNQLHSQPTIEYWCFVCEKEFSHNNTGPAEVFCPQCGCISEMIDPENDPRGFKPYDAQRETTNTNNNTNNNNTTNFNNFNPFANLFQAFNPGQPNQTTQNPQNRQRATVRISQMVVGPNGTYTIQTMNPQSVPQPRNPSGRRNSDPQGNFVPQEQPMPNFGLGVLNGMVGDPFSALMESFLPGITMRGGFLDDLQSRIIEEFLRNDPNRHGAPPASQESISKLKESLFDPEHCETKDCPVCQDDYNKGDCVLTMPCGHTFHKTCLTTWLTLHNSCPSCRKALNEEAENNTQ